MSNDRIKPLVLVAFAAFLAASVAQAQDKPKEPAAKNEPARSEQKAAPVKPIEETKPSEQTQDAAGGLAMPDYRDDRSTRRR